MTPIFQIWEHSHFSNTPQRDSKAPSEDTGTSCVEFGLLEKGMMTFWILLQVVELLN